MPAAEPSSHLTEVSEIKYGDTVYVVGQELNGFRMYSGKAGEFKGRWDFIIVRGEGSAQGGYDTLRSLCGHTPSEAVAKFLERYRGAYNEADITKKVTALLHDADMPTDDESLDLTEAWHHPQVGDTVWLVHLGKLISGKVVESHPKWSGLPVRVLWSGDDKSSMIDGLTAQYSPEDAVQVAVQRAKISWDVHLRDPLLHPDLRASYEAARDREVDELKALLSDADTVSDDDAMDLTEGINAKTPVDTPLFWMFQEEAFRPDVHTGVLKALTSTSAIIFTKGGRVEHKDPELCFLSPKEAILDWVHAAESNLRYAETDPRFGNQRAHYIAKYKGELRALHELLMKLPVDSADEPSVDDAMDLTEAKGLTVGDYAAEGTWDEVFRLIDLGKKADDRSKQGTTALIYAIREMNMDAAKRLLRHGANVNGKGSQGITPVMVAATCADPTWMQFLVDNGASLTRVDTGGWSILTYAAKNTLHPDCMEWIATQRPKIFKRFLNLPEDNGNTPLSLAVDRHNTEVVKVLLAHQASLNVTLKFSPHYALAQQAYIAGDGEILRMLLRAGAPFDLENVPEGLTEMAKIVEEERGHSADHVSDDDAMDLTESEEFKPRMGQHVYGIVWKIPAQVVEGEVFLTGPDSTSLKVPEGIVHVDNYTFGRTESEAVSNAMKKVLNRVEFFKSDPKGKSSSIWNSRLRRLQLLLNSPDAPSDDDHLELPE